ncbi:hypothetical protein ECC02_000215 [Trypanosoma cruzi]|uniref:Uncharacterized protein n=1 Tax=Trypanosoma cruzi TaxID=5693 RepID=A0A7J6YIX2_TRYCR|nr:hypothetical protein ECC02_000215 [Trypanosoma cruzi]
MSGLWSFRETAAPLPCLSDAARASLPTAAIDDFIEHAAVGVTDTSMEDPVRVFGLANDVDVAVQEVQNAWLERIVGHERASPYHLRLSHQEVSGAVTSQTENRVSTADGYEPLSPEEMAVVKSVLKMPGKSNERKGTSRVRRRGPTVPRAPVLHAAALVSQRKERQAFSGANAAEGTGMAVQKPIDHPIDRYEQKEKSLLHRDCSEKRTSNLTRHVSQMLHCTFLERMQRRAEKRRLARSALRTSRLPDSANGELSTAQNVPTDKSRKKQPNLQYDALPLEIQVALLSLEETRNTDGELNRYFQYEAIATRWHSAHLNKKAWECWRKRQRIRADRSEHNVAADAASSAAGACSLLQANWRSNLGPPPHAELAKLDANKMRTLRWYFVLWVAFLETARDGGVNLGISAGGA